MGDSSWRCNSMTSMDEKIADRIRTNPRLNALVLELKNLQLSKDIIDADAVQAQAAEIKPRACCPVIIAKEVPSRGESYATNI